MTIVRLVVVSDIAANIYLAIYWIEGIGIWEFDEDIIKNRIERTDVYEDDNLLCKKQGDLRRVNLLCLIDARRSKCLSDGNSGGSMIK